MIYLLLGRITGIEDLIVILIGITRFEIKYTEKKRQKKSILKKNEETVEMVSLFIS